MKFGKTVRRGRQQLAQALQRASRPFSRLWPCFPEALVGMCALGLVVFGLLTYSTTLSRSASKTLGSNRYLALANGLLNPFRNQHLLLESGLPVYDLKIKRGEYAKIEKAIEQAAQQGYMSEDSKVWANAKFLYNGEEYDVKVRVRGDLPVHWQGPKKSWRIKFGKEKLEHNGTTIEEEIPFQGKRQINLILPNDRDYVLAAFVNELMREQGLTVLRDQFVILRINGILQGLYYEVEHFDKPLLAAHRRPETTVFAQNDRAMHFEQYTKYGTPAVSDARFDIGALRRLVDPQGDLGLRAMQILFEHSLHPTAENFRRVRAVLDWEKYLRFRILTTLCNTNHVRFGSDNLRLYYDESRGLLEPIPWDLHLTRMPKEPGTIDFWNSHGPDEIQRATLLDPALRLQRNRMLWELVADGGQRLMAKYDELHNRIRPLAWADVLATPIQGYKMDAHRENLLFNVRRVHKVLSLSSANLLYRLDAANRAALEVTALNFSGIRLQQVELADPAVLEGSYRLYEDTNDNNTLDRGDLLLAQAVGEAGLVRFALDRLVMPQVRYDGDFIEGRYWEYFDTLAGRARFFLVGKLAPGKRHPLEWTPPRIHVVSENAVTGRPLPAAVLQQGEALPADAMAIAAYDASDPFDLDAPERTLAEFLRAHPQFGASPDHSGAAELRGRVTLSGTVIVPKSVPLVLNPGTEITMMPGASLVSYGGLTALATPEKRIHIRDNGSGDPWGTFAVVRPPHKVVLRYVDVQGAGQAQINGILFTGGFAVYEADLEIEHCRFVNMKSEDAVNLKNGRVRIIDTLFQGNDSDAVDLDFVTGEVRDNVFRHNKGDGLDLSGSKVLVVGNRFEYMGDKGLSVGEDSHPTVLNNLFLGNNIGISTKDLSWPRVAYSTFVGNKLAIEAKRKKPMFGPGGGEFLSNVFSANARLLEEDYFSRGRVRLTGSLLDSPAVPCSSCQVATARFVSQEAGDYRLEPGFAPAANLSAAKAEWALSELQATGLSPRQPGIVAPSHRAEPKRQ